MAVTKAYKIPPEKSICSIVDTVGQGPIALTVGAGGTFLLSYIPFSPLSLPWGWSGGAMVLGKLPVPGRPTI